MIMDAGESQSEFPRLSIVLPVLNEQEHIGQVLSHLEQLKGAEQCEIIVVDGDPEGGTIKTIEDDAVVTLVGPRGRAAQMNAGATRAAGENLLFLHADTRLPADAVGKVLDTLDNRRYVAGAFDLEIDSHRWVLRHIAARARRRSRGNRIPYGDQAIFIKKDYFEMIGGYREIPLMEDVDLMRRIKRRRDEICILDERVLTSPRRWEKEGVIFTSVRNQVLIGLFYLGVSPRRLARFYRLCSGR